MLPTGDQRLERGEEKAMCPVHRVVGGQGHHKRSVIQGDSDPGGGCCLLVISLLSPWSWEKGFIEVAKATKVRGVQVKGMDPRARVAGLYSLSMACLPGDLGRVVPNV